MFRRFPVVAMFLAVALCSASEQGLFPSAQTGAEVKTVPLQVIQLADDDGSRLARVTAPEMRAWVTFANKAFAPASVRFTFGGTAKDHITLKNTLLNQMGPSHPKFRAAFVEADRVAAKYPGKLTVFVRWGPDKGPTGAAYGGHDWNFVIMGAYKAMRHCGHAHHDAFAHELGHYFGLPHTFVGEPFTSLKAAEEYLRARGNRPEVFDGDGFTDTAPDPAIRGLECVRTKVITLNGLKFTLPRRNLMSYYDERDSLTKQQLDRVRWLLRVRLENRMAMPRNESAAPIEAEALKVSDARDANTAVQSMKGFGMLGWSGDKHLFVQAKKGGSLALTFTAPATGRYQVSVFLTRAPDFGTVQFSLDGKVLGRSVDLYAPLVMPSGRITLGKVELRKGEHRLQLRITGKSERSSNYYCGVDCLELVPAP